MKKLTADDPETRSADIVAENVAQLRLLFPEAFTERRIDFEVLKQLLDGAVDERDEKYGLHWHGKRLSRHSALTPSTGTLRPCPELSANWDTTQNLMIEGDNLEVLKLLQKPFSSKVKLIYIDPPYNTGKDFVYPDSFHDSITAYLELTGQLEGERRASSNPHTGGRFHTAWLSMMLPRLRLAWSLLRKDGFIVVSIDDIELPRLRLLLDEVFGEENFISVLVFDRNRKNDAKLVSVGHEYMVVYARDKALLSELKVKLRAPKEGVDDVRERFERLRTEHGDNWELVGQGLKAFYAAFSEDDPRKPLARFTNVDERGPFRVDGDPSWPGGGGPRYDVPHPVTGRPCKVPSRGWVWPTFERMKEEIDAGNIVFGPDESTVPSLRRNLFEKSDQVMRSVQFSYAQTATQSFAALFDGEAVFQNPKSYDDLRRLVEYFSEPGDIVMDFFAGSGTTGHGVMLADVTSHRPRRFVLVQLPEALSADNVEQAAAWRYCIKHELDPTIASITQERLRRSARAIAEDHPLAASDLGFRVFRLAETNIRQWAPDRDNLPTSLEEAVEHLRQDRTESDILYELLLKFGLDLCVPIEERAIAGKAVYSIGGGTLLACLADRITADAIEPLGLGIVEWHKALAPAGDTTCVFRDGAFADDVAKTNLTAILQQHGLQTVRSL